MLIYFSQNSFKYEIEAVAKLFFPVIRFTHVFDDDIYSNKADSLEDFIFTRLKISKKSNTTLLWVYVKINNNISRKSIKISNDIINYNDECERNLCVLLYQILQNITNITPKWGILTGVRPVSLIQKYIKKGWTKDDIYSYFINNFLVSTQKLDLAYNTAQVQLDVLNLIDENSYSLYVAIPFCVSKCSYCSFVSHPIKKNDIKVDQYLTLLLQELEKTAQIVSDLNLNLSTIYIGGGTPTALNETQLKTLVDGIAQFFPIHQASEYTIEAGRVDTINKEKLLIIKNAWGNVSPNEKSNVRISINPQTFNDEVLTNIKRNHTGQQVIDCYNLAVDLGFIHINMDFIAGLPNDTLQSFKSTIDTAIKLSPSNITVHTLSIKRSGDLFKSYNLDENHFDEIFSTQYMNDYAQEILIENGYQPYYLYRQKNTLGNLENVGYKKSDNSSNNHDYLSLYNIYIMEEIHTIMACGAGGVTKIIANQNSLNHGIKPINRIFNYKYHFEYIDKFDEILKRKDEVILYYVN